VSITTLSDTALVDLDTLRAWFKISDGSQDALLSIAGNAASEAIEHWCGRRFVRATYEDVILSPSRRGAHVALPEYPVESLTTLEQREGLGEAWEELVVDEDYELDPDSGLVYFVTPAALVPRSLRATYIGGVTRANLSPDLVQACLDFAKLIYDRHRTGTVATQTVNLAAGGSITITPKLPQDICDRIKRYRRVRLG
jgi:uncharacterized phiE125 gp8 family phage protein